jgi:hypothetical protein
MQQLTAHVRTLSADTLAAALVPEGYSCFFRAKKPSPALKFGFPADGIALFYRHSRFNASPAPSGACCCAYRAAQVCAQKLNAVRCICGSRGV